MIERHCGAVPLGSEAVDAIRGHREEREESSVGGDLDRCPVDGQPGPPGPRGSEEEVLVAHGEGGPLGGVPDL